MSDNEYIDEARFVGQDRTSRMTEEVIFRDIDDDQINTERTSSFTSVDLSDSPRRDNDNSSSHNSGNGISV